MYTVCYSHANHDNRHDNANSRKWYAKVSHQADRPDNSDNCYEQGQNNPSDVPKAKIEDRNHHQNSYGKQFRHGAAGYLAYFLAHYRLPRQIHRFIQSKVSNDFLDIADDALVIRFWEQLNEDQCHFPIRGDDLSGVVVIGQHSTLQLLEF